MFTKSRRRKKKVNSDSNKLPLKTQWMLVTLALMGFAEKYHYYYQIGQSSDDNLNSNTNLDKNANPNKEIYSPQSGDFINYKLKIRRQNNNNEVTSTGSKAIKFKSKYYDYTYDLSNPIDTVLKANKMVKKINEEIENKNNDEMRDDSMNNKNRDDGKLRDLFAESLADNVAGQNDTSPNHTIVKNTILNQIETNKVLSEEYNHFLQIHSNDNNSSVDSNVSDESKKPADHSAVIYEAQTASIVDNPASSNIELAPNVLNDLQNNAQTSPSLVSDNSSSNNNDANPSNSATDGNSAVEGAMENQSNNTDYEFSKDTKSKLSNPADTYFDSADSGYSRVSSVNNLVSSVADYVNGSRSNFDETFKNAHETTNQTSRYIDKIDNNGKRISPYFGNLSDDEQTKINQINNNVQSVATENDSIADQFKKDSGQIASYVNQINNDVTGVKNAFADAERFFSAASLSYRNKDGNATNIYASYVNSAASVAVDQRDNINNTLNSFNSILDQKDSYVDQITSNDSLMASNAEQNSQILDSIENSLSTAKASESAAQSARASESAAQSARASESAAQSARASESVAQSVRASESAAQSIRAEEERQNSILASQSAQSEAQQASIADQQQREAHHDQLGNIITQQQFESNSEDESPSSLSQSQFNQTQPLSSFDDNLNFDNQFESQIQDPKSQTNDDNSVIDADVQKEMDTISDNHNHAAQMVNEMDAITKKLDIDNQHLQDLFALLKGEFNQTKDIASKGQTTNMVAMTIAKMDALMTNASQIIGRVKQVNQNNNKDYQTSIESLNKIKQYQDQLASIIKISQTFDPLTAMSVNSMAETTLNRTNDYYKQIKKVNDDLMDASRSIQTEISTMNSYYQTASKNSQLMDSINQMSSVTSSISERSEQISALYDNVHSEFINLDTFKSQADSLMNKMAQVKDYIAQKHFAINEYVSMMPKNDVLEELGQQVSLAAEDVHSAQNDIQSNSNNIAQTYSMANTPMSSLSDMRDKANLTKMNNEYYASQAIINFNIGNTVNVDNSIKQINSYQQSLASMYSVASTAAEDVHSALERVNPQDSFQSLAKVADSASSTADTQMSRAVDIYNGLSIGIDRANSIATNVSHLFDESGEMVASSDQVLTNVNENIQHVNSNLNAIKNSNNITDLYSRRVRDQVSDSNSYEAQQVDGFAQKSKQSVTNLSKIKMSLQQISLQLAQRQDAMKANYSLIYKQADTANQYIQHSFEQLSQGNLDIANDYLDQAKTSVNDANQTLSRYQNDLDWAKSMINNTNQMINQTEQINIVVSDNADKTQKIADQLNITK